MRPDVITWLDSAGLSPLTRLIPQPGVVYSIVVIVAGTVFLYRARAVGIAPTRSLEIILTAAVSGAIGARLFFLLTTGDLLRTGPSTWLDPSRGTASWGAWLGAIGGVLAYTGFSRMSPWPILDTAISCGGLAEFIGRWSCVLAGDDFGRVSSASWAIRFPENSLAYQAQVTRGVLSPEATASLPVHPFQFYLMVNGLLLFLLLSAVWRRKRSRPGHILVLYLIGYGSTRFFWEFFRDPAAGGAEGTLSVSQWMCLAFLIVGAGILLRSRRRSPPDRRSPQRTPAT